MIIAVLLALLAGAISLIAALAAFIITRICGQSAFVAIRNAGVTFALAFTLLLLVLTFVESTRHEEQARAQSTTAITLQTVARNGEHPAVPQGLWEARPCLSHVFVMDGCAAGTRHWLRQNARSLHPHDFEPQEAGAEWWL